MKLLYPMIFCALLPLKLFASEFVLLLIPPEDTELVELYEDDLNVQELLASPESFEEYLLQNRSASERKQRRLDDLVRQRQSLFREDLRRFIEIDIDRDDPESHAAFVTITKRVVKRTFDAVSDRDFYEKIYLINQSWLENSSEVERFAYLDNELSKENLRREERRRKLKRIVTNVTTVAGVALGAYGSYIMSKKIVPIKADEKLLPLILKWSGRVPVFLVGSSVGAAAGAYFGFLGSQWLFSKNELYIDPIDGTEDLKDILDIINELP